MTKRWKAKKSNMSKRVDLYSNPGVSEIIFHDEWNSSSTSIINLRNIIISIIILGISYYIIF